MTFEWICLISVCFLLLIQSLFRKLSIVDNKMSELSVKNDQINQFDDLTESFHNLFREDFNRNSQSEDRQSNATNHWKSANEPKLKANEEKLNATQLPKNQGRFRNKNYQKRNPKPYTVEPIANDLDLSQLSPFKSVNEFLDACQVTKECQICSEWYSIDEMESMYFCVHMCCINCAKQYFTLQIKEKALNYCVCPICQEPKWLSEGDSTSSCNVTDYFGLMDIFLRRILDKQTHDLFQIKIRDFSLNKEENFKWCTKCSYGYFIDNAPNKKYGICESCGYISCLSCDLPWKSQHDGISCEMFQKWLKDNDYSQQKHGIDEYLKKNGITCPKCKFQFSLSRGGCMHFKCTQCKHEFCSGCNEPFFMSSVCGKSKYCYKLGLHAHHPRNCLFYLRDKEPDELQRLLIDNNIDFVSNIDNNNTHCLLPLQKEDSNGKLYDEKCNKTIESNQHGGFCKEHYVEYLCKLIKSHEIEPLAILDIEDFENLVLRAGKRLPPNAYGTPKDMYRKRLLEISLH